MTPKAPPRSLMLDLRELQKTNKIRRFKKQTKSIGFGRFFEHPASSFHLLFDVDQRLPQDRLQIAPRTLQDALRRPTASNMGPAWAQHGANMGAKRGPRSVQWWSKCSPEGISSSDCCPTAHMNPKSTPTWGQHGVILGSSWNHLGVILGSYWGHLGVILRSSWGHLGVNLG